MADSAFWRDFADQFESLHSRRSDLGANWQYKSGSGGAAEWTLFGDNGQKAKFEALARRAAIGLRNKRSQDLLVAWLEALREFGSLAGRGRTQFATESNEDGSVRATYVLGSIGGICEASAHVCKMLESRSLQAEFEEEQRSDPKNGPPLLKQFEAFKSLEGLFTGPVEQIPEALIRRFVADRDGIPPEDVTQQQIQFEVTALLPYYPAITVTPHDDPAAGSPEKQGLQQPQAQKNPALPPINKTSRKQFVEAILTEKGWSILDWSNEAGVAYHTAADYLSGVKNPYRSTRVKLARALGVSPNQLPE